MVLTPRRRSPDRGAAAAPCWAYTARPTAAFSPAIPTPWSASTPPSCSTACRPSSGAAAAAGSPPGATRRRDRARRRERAAPQPRAARCVDLPSRRRARAARRHALPARHSRGSPGQSRRAGAPIRSRGPRPLDGANRPRIAAAGPWGGAAPLPAPCEPLPPRAPRRRRHRRRAGGTGGVTRRLGWPERRVAALGSRPDPRAADRPPRQQRALARAVVVRRSGLWTTGRHR